MQTIPRRRFLRAFGGAFLAPALTLSACDVLSVGAMNSVNVTRFSVDGSRLIMNGAINSRTPEQFDAVYDANPQIRTIVLQDVPGSLDDENMIALGYRVRGLGLATHLTATSVVASGGVDLFLAGVRRTMEPGGQLGVHSWSDGFGDGSEYPPDAREHDLNRNYIRAMLGAEDFYWFTLYSAPSDGIHFLTEAEIRHFGLLTG